MGLRPQTGTIIACHSKAARGGFRFSLVASAADRAFAPSPPGEHGVACVPPELSLAARFGDLAARYPDRNRIHGATRFAVSAVVVDGVARGQRVPLVSRDQIL